jgi:purine nucleoside permease
MTVFQEAGRAQALIMFAEEASALRMEAVQIQMIITVTLPMLPSGPQAHAPAQHIAAICTKMRNSSARQTTAALILAVMRLTLALVLLLVISALLPAVTLTGTQVSLIARTVRVVLLILGRLLLGRFPVQLRHAVGMTEPVMIGLRIAVL